MPSSRHSPALFAVLPSPQSLRCSYWVFVTLCFLDCAALSPVVPTCCLPDRISPQALLPGLCRLTGSTLLRVAASITISHTTALDPVTGTTEQESICLQTSMNMCELLLLLFLSDLVCVMESDSFLEILYSSCQHLLKKIHNCPPWSQKLGDKSG